MKKKEEHYVYRILIIRTQEKKVIILLYRAYIRIMKVRGSQYLKLSKRRKRVES